MEAEQEVINHKQEVTEESSHVEDDRASGSSETRERVYESRGDISGFISGLGLFSNLCDLTQYPFNRETAVNDVETCYKFCNIAMNTEVGIVPMSKAGEKQQPTALAMPKKDFWDRVNLLRNTALDGNPTTTMVITLRSEAIKKIETVDGIPFRMRSSLIGFRVINTDNSVQYGIHPYFWKLILEHYRGNARENITGIHPKLMLSFHTPAYKGGPWKIVIDFSEAITNENVVASTMYAPRRGTTQHVMSRRGNYNRGAPRRDSPNE